jgi:tRNA (adenine57-N1/adenine58-N1)-methyltransferase
MPDPAPRGFRPGEPIEFLQFGKPAFRTVLRPGASANVRGHRFKNDLLVGLEPGTAVRSQQGETFFLARPTLADWVESMPRHAKTIYPKEAGPILLHGDVFPGARVLEAGLGSGGLTLSLLRAVGPTGQVISYDLREKSLEKGQANVALWHGEAPANHTVRERDVYAGIDAEDRGLDRLILDVPEPWQVVPHAREALLPGGILVAFLPSVTQAHELVNALRNSGAWAEIKTLETMQRAWKVGRQSARPENQGIPHTGFLTFARHVAPEPVIDPAERA